MKIKECLIVLVFMALINNVCGDEMVVAPPEVHVGETFIVNVTINGSDMRAVHFELIYNRSVLNATNVTAGDLITDAGCIPVENVTVENVTFPSINNTVGNVSFSSACLETTMNGSGTIAEITFKAISSGTYLNLTNAYIFGSGGRSDVHNLTVMNASITVLPSSIPLSSGWNLIGLPLNATYTAEEMLDEIASQGGNCTWAYEWTGTWNGHKYNGPNNFDMSVGKGYFLQCNKNSNWTIEGTPLTTPVTESLGAGWNLISVPYNTPSMAEDMLEQIASQEGNCTWAYEWTGTWNGHKYNGPNDFNMSVGKGYFVQCITGTTWTPT